MSEPREAPYSIAPTKFAGQIAIIDRNGTLVCYTTSQEDAAHIVKCVNEQPAKDALIKELVEGLEKLARLGNEPHFGNSKGNVIAQELLARAEEMMK